MEGLPAPDPRNLIVNYIPTPVTDEDLRTLFSPCGQIETARVIVDKTTGHPKGYGFVKFADVESAQRAIEQMNGVEVQNKRLKVTPAKGPCAGGSHNPSPPTSGPAAYSPAPSYPGSGNDNSTKVPPPMSPPAAHPVFQQPYPQQYMQPMMMPAYGAQGAPVMYVMMPMQMPMGQPMMMPQMGQPMMMPVQPSMMPAPGFAMPHAPDGQLPVFPHAVAPRVDNQPMTGNSFNNTLLGVSGAGLPSNTVSPNGSLDGKSSMPQQSR